MVRPLQFSPLTLSTTQRRPRQRFRPVLESLEKRLVPYSLTGNQWLHPERITISFVPDGTDLNVFSDGQWQVSSLISNFNARFPTALWQKEFKKAAQAWAQQTNLNFVFVGDTGLESGGGSYQQGDPNMGDIRVAGFVSAPTWLGAAAHPQPANNTSLAGDHNYNLAHSWSIPGSSGSYDLFTVALHEIGHSLGLGHSTVSYAAMYPSYSGASTLALDDILGIRALYSNGLPRSPDSFDAVLPNDTFLTATNVTSYIGGTGTAIINARDITATYDYDYYRVTVPAGMGGSFQVRMQSAGLSQLAPAFAIYNSNYQLLQYFIGAGQYGSTLTFTVNNVSPGQHYYFRAFAAEGTAFGTGSYALIFKFLGGQIPAATPPNTQVANGNPPVNGGGMNLGADGHAEHGAEGPLELMFGPEHDGVIEVSITSGPEAQTLPPETLVAPLPEATVDRLIVAGLSPSRVANADEVLVNSQVVSPTFASTPESAVTVSTEIAIARHRAGVSVVDAEQSSDGEEELPPERGSAPTPEAAPATPEEAEQIQMPDRIDPDAIDCLFRTVPELNLLLLTAEGTARDDLAPALETDLAGQPAWALAGTLAGAWSLQIVNRRQDDDRRRLLI